MCTYFKDVRGHAGESIVGLFYRRVGCWLCQIHPTSDSNQILSFIRINENTLNVLLIRFVFIFNTVSTLDFNCSPFLRYLFCWKIRKKRVQLSLSFNHSACLCAGFFVDVPSDRSAGGAIRFVKLSNKRFHKEYSARKLFAALYLRQSIF